MNVKKTIKNAVLAAAVGAASLTSANQAYAKSLNLRAAKEDAHLDYEKAVWVKVSENSTSYSIGNIFDLGKGYHLNANIKDQEVNSAILGENLGIESSTDFGGNSKLTIEGMIAGIGGGITRNWEGDRKTVTGSIFRAERINNISLYGEISGNKDSHKASFLGFYFGPKIGEAKLIPALSASKTFTSKDYKVTPGVVVSSGKVSAFVSAKTTDFKKWIPSVKIKYKF